MADYIKWLREHVGSQKILMVSASVGIMDSAGRLLWQQRSDFGWWGLPGGSLELNEDLASCAVREAKEETELDIAIDRLIGVYSSEAFCLRYPNGDELKVVSCLFRCQVVGGQLRPVPGEAIEARFFRVAALPEMSERYAVRVAALLANRPGAFIN